MPLRAEKAASMSYKKSVLAGDIDSKVRNCLACRRRFKSEWAGERICPKCKRSRSWRRGSAFQYGAVKRS
jgi:hypothetical protein